MALTQLTDEMVPSEEICVAASDFPRTSCLCLRNAQSGLARLPLEAERSSLGAGPC